MYSTNNIDFAEIANFTLIAIADSVLITFLEFSTLFLRLTKTLRNQ